MKLDSTVDKVTQRVRERSAALRQAYLQRLDAAASRGPGNSRMGCANLAHAFAAMPQADKGRVMRIQAERAPNIGIVTAYNDMLSAHAPLQSYPDMLKDEARRLGATAQVAGGVPAMCDGVTQGQAGMELSLFSRDVIAMATAVSLSHDVFDGALLLGVCDKIVPGLLIGALHFGHLPTVFVPAGPMTSGLPNEAKAKVREQAAQGLVGREALQEAENQAYHGRRYMPLTVSMSDGKGIPLGVFAGILRKIFTNARRGSAKTRQLWLPRLILDSQHDDTAATPVILSEAKDLCRPSQMLRSRSA